MTTTKMMSCCLAGDGMFHSSSSRKTPIPMPAMNATVRLTMAPMSAAVSAYRSRSARAPASARWSGWAHSGWP